MKITATTFLLVLLTLNTWAKESRVDSTALMILDHMSQVIGELQSLNVNIEIRNDVIDRESGLMSHFSESDLILDGPDKMLIHTKGGKGHRGFWYNGSRLAFYSFDENNYVIFEALPTTLQTIDSLNRAFGIDFPAADFLYPTFTSDLLANNDEIIFNGRTNIENKECFHIVVHGSEFTIQLWLSSGALTLPVKMLIINKSALPNLQYEATFGDWKINQAYPPSIFEFLPPPGSHEIKMLPKNAK
jgi:hypothetical protein